MAVDTTPSLLENLDTAASALQGIVTALALVVGGVWAYFKFFKGRVYRPRLDVTIATAVFVLEGRKNLVCHLAVKNIGTSKVALVQEGTALTITRGDPGTEPYRMPLWGESSVFEVFPEHQWIESGETIRHDLSVALPDEFKDVLMVNLRLICRQGKKNIEANSRAILLPGSPTQEVSDGQGGAAT